MVQDIPYSIEQILTEITTLWAGALRNRRSPFHTPIVCTVKDASPSPRIMVLRAASEDGMRFRFHTDARSPKTAEIGMEGPVSVLGYDPDLRIQLTVRGIGRIHRSGEHADTAWQDSALSSRRCYLAAHPPGTPVTAPISGLPDHLLDRSPTEVESQDGRMNFAILMIEAQELEWLKLTSCGNKRALFRRDGDQWAGQWITP
jgi:pyridoxamine 5'-phosphate oxidase